jgi:hypothetical protein
MKSDVAFALVLLGVVDLREVVGQKIRPTTAVDEKRCGFRSRAFGCVRSVRGCWSENKTNNGGGKYCG